MWLKIVFGIFLYMAFFLLFVWFGAESMIRRLMHRTFETIDAAARQRVNEKRRLMSILQERKGLVYRIEQRLVYSGLVFRCDFLTPELWILGNLAVCAIGYFVALVGTGNFLIALAVLVATQIFHNTLVSIMMARNYRAVNDNLMKFLDFLGNYSITVGEVTGIMNQISKYLDEPLCSVLEACYYEAQITGDTSLALLSMSEKIEHPRFKELVRNLEICVRYSADFTLLVSGSKRALREHMRTRQERRALANEALINMLMLAGMSVVILLTVGQLTETSMQQILFQTMIGRICLVVIALIFVLLYGQMRRLDR